MKKGIQTKFIGELISRNRKISYFIPFSNISLKINIDKIFIYFSTKLVFSVQIHSPIANFITKYNVLQDTVIIVCNNHEFLNFNVNNYNLKLSKFLKYNILLNILNDTEKKQFIFPKTNIFLNCKKIFNWDKFWEYDKKTFLHLFIPLIASFETKTVLEKMHNKDCLNQLYSIIIKHISAPIYSKSKIYTINYLGAYVRSLFWKQDKDCIHILPYLNSRWFKDCFVAGKISFYISESCLVKLHWKNKNIYKIILIQNNTEKKFLLLNGYISCRLTTNFKKYDVINLKNKILVEGTVYLDNFLHTNS